MTPILQTQSCMQDWAMQDWTTFGEVNFSLSSQNQKANRLKASLTNTHSSSEQVQSPNQAIISTNIPTNTKVPPAKASNSPVLPTVHLQRHYIRNSFYNKTEEYWTITTTEFYRPEHPYKPPTSIKKQKQYKKFGKHHSHVFKRPSPH